jgi:multiple antibiotic resistance protein
VLAREFILTAMPIPFPAFQVAGGIVLFLFALTFGERKPDEEVKLVYDNHETAVYPLAVPSISAPGAMLAAVLMTETHRVSFWEQAQTASMILAVLFIVYLLMIMSGPINKLIGASVVSRVMGLILASVATLSGIKLYIVL